MLMVDVMWLQVAAMPKEEVELEVGVKSTGKGKKPRAAAPAGAPLAGAPGAGAAPGAAPVAPGALPVGVAAAGAPGAGGRPAAAGTVTSSVPVTPGVPNSLQKNSAVTVTPVGSSTNSRVPVGGAAPATVPGTVPGSTATTTVPTAHPLGTHNLPKQVAPPPPGGVPYHAQPAITNPALSSVPAGPVLAGKGVGAPPVIPPAQPAKVKKGVKRKADTTTPTTSALDPIYPPLDAKSAKIASRRESGRQIKKVR